MKCVTGKEISENLGKYVGCPCVRVDIIAYIRKAVYDIRERWYDDSSENTYWIFDSEEEGIHFCEARAARFLQEYKDWEEENKDFLMYFLRVNRDKIKYDALSIIEGTYQP